MRSLQGQLLVASPYLSDDDFKRTVILLLHHDQEGAVGIVLNRPAGQTVESPWDRNGSRVGQNQQQVNLGGPVKGPLMVLQQHKSSSDSAQQPGAGAIVAPAQLGALPGRPSGPFRLFVGHARWDQQQLESEIESGAWLVTPATVDLVFGKNSEMWQTAVRHIGRELIGSALSIKHMPEDPSLN